MEEIKLAFEVLASWMLLCIFSGLMAVGLYLFIELWKTDRKNLLKLMAVGAGGVVTGIVLAMIQ